MAIINTQSTFDLIDGPNRDDLFDSAKRSYDGNKIPVTFVSTQRHKYSAIISGIEHEDSSGHSFILKGFLADPALPRHRPDRYHIPFEGYFHCRARNSTRAGFLKVTVQHHTPNDEVTDEELRWCAEDTLRTYC